MMTFDELLKALGDQLGIELTQDDGTCALQVDDMEVRIHHLAQADLLLLDAEVGAPPPQGLDGLHQTMLNANYLHAGTGAATLSRKSDDGTYHLQQADWLGRLDGASLADALERFIDTLEMWRRLLADYREHTAHDDDDDDAPEDSQPSAADPLGPVDLGSFSGGFLRV